MGDCYNDFRDYLPFVGCQWRAGAREAPRAAADLATYFSASAGEQARALLGADWFTGMDYLVRQTRDEGIGAAALTALDVAGPAMLYQAGQFIGWTAERCDRVLRLALGKQQEWLGRRIGADIQLAKLDADKAADLKRRFRSGDYQTKLQQATEYTTKLNGYVKDLAGLGADTQNLALSTAAAKDADRAAGYGAWQLPVLGTLSAGTIAAAAAVAVVLIGLFEWLKTREVRLSEEAGVAYRTSLAEKEARGEVPKGTTKAAEEAAKAEADARAKAVTWEAVTAKALDALPWLVGGAAALYLLPVVVPVLAPVAAGVGGALGRLVGRGSSHGA